MSVPIGCGGGEEVEGEMEEEMALNVVLVILFIHDGGLGRPNASAAAERGETNRCEEEEEPAPLASGVRHEEKLESSP